MPSRQQTSISTKTITIERQSTQALEVGTKTTFECNLSLYDCMLHYPLPSNPQLPKHQQLNIRGMVCRQKLILTTCHLKYELTSMLIYNKLAELARQLTVASFLNKITCLPFVNISNRIKSNTEWVCRGVWILAALKCYVTLLTSFEKSSWSWSRNAKIVSVPRRRALWFTRTLESTNNSEAMVKVTNSH